RDIDANTTAVEMLNATVTVAIATAQARTSLATKQRPTTKFMPTIPQHPISLDTPKTNIVIILIKEKKSHHKPDYWYEILVKNICCLLGMGACLLTDKRSSFR
ncbi:MAG: hypothetical protein J6V16_09075, partial [Bacteroidales bacterium]|nr:hypothetical protein [Bacteroidales bacterium]